MQPDLFTVAVVSAISLARHRDRGVDSAPFTIGLMPATLLAPAHLTVFVTVQHMDRYL
jgi:hypothetical protein